MWVFPYGMGMGMTLSLWVFPHVSFCGFSCGFPADLCGFYVGFCGFSCGVMWGFLCVFPYGMGIGITLSLWVFPHEGFCGFLWAGAPNFSKSKDNFGVPGGTQP